MLRTNIRTLQNRTVAVAIMAGSLLVSTATFADPLSHTGFFNAPHRVVEHVVPDPAVTANRQDAIESAPNLRRQIVAYVTREAPGTIVIDTPNTYLYLVLGGGRAIRYGIGVGREGFTWSGVKTVERKAEWPDWNPPAEMLERQPYLPRFMAGGPGNPLGARAMYLGGTVYRIHGTNDPSTIGKRVSSGCIRLVNDDVEDLYARVNVGTKVVVLPMQAAHAPGLAVQVRSVPYSTRTAAANASRAHGLY
jgi:lipoprotein-anchoring transpeptidase ErfK/SrfK